MQMHLKTSERKYTMYPKHHHWKHGVKSEHKKKDNGPWVVVNTQLEAAIGDKDGPFIYDNKEFALEEARDCTAVDLVDYEIRDVSGFPMESNWSTGDKTVQHKIAVQRIRSKP